MTKLKLTASQGLGLILAGGRSQRLFPIDFPKPLLKVKGETLLEGAMKRLKGLDVHIVCSAAIKRATEKALKRKPSFIVEPEARDTAGAVGFALRTIERHVRQKNSQWQKKKWMAVISADHYFPISGFDRVVKTLMKEIENYPDSLFVLGSPEHFKPRENHSQFGWIVAETSADVAQEDREQGGGQSRDRGQNESRAVRRFVEKPGAEILESLYRDGALINGGMFFGLIETFRKAYAAHFPEAIDNQCRFDRLPKQPIDRAIFEKFSKVRVLQLDLPWEDLGTWSDWARLGLEESGRKHVRKSSTKRVTEAKDTFVWSDDETEVSVFGMNDVAVVKSGKRILVMPLSKTAQMKDYLQ